MRVSKQIGFRGFLVLLLISLLVACGGKEERKAKYLERGKAYLAEKNYEKAGIEFKNVAQIDPKDARAFLYLGEVAEKEQEWAQAFGNYKRAIDLDPELIKPRTRLAQFYLAQAAAEKRRESAEGEANAMGLAQEQVKEVLTRDSGNLEGLTLEASIWVHEGKNAEAIQQLEKVLSRDPGVQSAAGLLAALYIQDKRTDEAEKILLKAIESSEEPDALRNRLAVFYRSQERNDKAEEIYRALIKDNPDELPHRVSLAAFFSQTKQLDKAESVLRESIAADPEDAQRYLLLTQFLASQRDNDTAIKELESVATSKPDLTDLQFGLVQLYLGNDRKDDAKVRLDKLIDDQGVEPAGLRARAVLAQILAAEKDESGRVDTLIAEVLDENPRDNDALLLRGRLAAGKKGLDCSNK